MKNSKIVPTVISSLFFSSCSILEEGSIAPGYVGAYQAIKTTLFKQVNLDITPEVIERIPYASAKLSIGRGKEGLVILESIKGNKQTWVSADGVFLVFKNGRIIQTAGLDNNLAEIFSDYDVNEYITIKSLAFSSYYSFKDPALNNLKVDIKVDRVGLKEIELFNRVEELILYEERISNKNLGWNATNKYYFDREGVLIKSVQSISPKLPKFYFEVTKKPAL